jgi:hypothetical protein
VNWNPYPPLPLGAVRDLLGITRAMYRATVADDPRDVCRLQALEDIGRTLRAVLSARRAHGAPLLELAPLVAATARRVSRGRQTMG